MFAGVGISKRICALGVAAAVFATPASADELTEAVAADYDYVFDLYKHFHANPELSLQERETAKRLATELKALGFAVTENVGRDWVRKRVLAETGERRDTVDGYGVVAIMKNGDGPTVMLRADMDALPLLEKTGLSYASKVEAIDYRGNAAPVMHACAHDSHVAMLIGVARQLVNMKDKWSGTLMLIGQPAEEIGLGAISMLDDKLFERFPKPEFALSMHTSGYDPAGVVAYTPGFAMANVDSVDITIRGVGAHGSAPHMGKDPIVIGAQIVNALQTLVSRETNPLEAGVVTVGAFNAGFKHNIIPDEAKLQITVRSYRDDVRDNLLAGIKRIAAAQALSAGLPPELAPIVTIESDYTPATYNDPDLAARVMGAVATELGAERVVERVASMGGEDFGRFGKVDGVTSLLFWIGSVPPEQFEGGKTPPANHSPFYAPDPEPTLTTGVEAMTAAVLELFGKK